MSIARKITEGASGGSGGSGGYVDDVFSTYLYEGTYTSRDIVNGIDLDDKGGLVWLKCRTQDNNHFLFDTERGAGEYLRSNDNSAGGTQLNMLSSFNSDGFSLGTNSNINLTDQNYASWTFAKQKGFFDVVTYTGNGVAGHVIPHNLGSEPGMIIVKATSATKNWSVFHRSTGNTKALSLNESIAADTSTGYWNDTDPTSTDFTVGSASNVNQNNTTYVAYLFADDAPMFGPDGDESIIKCGTFPGADSTVDLGWEPQYVLMKPSSASGPWTMLDSMRGWTGYGVGGNQPLRPNESAAEINDDASLGGLTSTGFYVYNVGAADYIYMAIRRPNKPAEEFEPEELFATDNAGPADPFQMYSGFPVDMAWNKYTGGSADNYLSARLLQDSKLVTNSTSASAVDSDFSFDFMEGWHEGGRGTGTHSWMFRRAPGFFDVVTYEGDGVNGRELPHNLAAVPEMIWFKQTDNGGPWKVYSKSLPIADQLVLNSSDAPQAFNIFGGVPPTSEVVTLSSGDPNSGESIAYLWASVPGICDIGSYTGIGDAQYIDCGFDTAIPRFVLIKAASESGDWYYWDTLRGIVSGNDPYLLLNSTAAQVTNQNWISPSPHGLIGGFYLNSSSASQIYKDGVEYIYMAIA